MRAPKPQFPEIPDTLPTGQPKRGLICVSCRRGDHRNCDRQPRHMPSFALAVCECDDPSHGAPAERQATR